MIETKILVYKKFGDSVPLDVEQTQLNDIILFVSHKIHTLLPITFKKKALKWYARFPTRNLGLGMN